jgi:hypothetical protein
VTPETDHLQGLQGLTPPFWRKSFITYARGDFMEKPPSKPSKPSTQEPRNLLGTPRFQVNARPHSIIATELFQTNRTRHIPTHQ